MIALLQKVNQAKVKFEDRTVSRIEKGILVFLGVVEKDSQEDCLYIARKIANIRIFEDKNRKMNLNCKQVKGKVLVVPEFTLASDTKKGNRPSFAKAASYRKAKALYEKLVNLLNEKGLKVLKGKFGKHMQVELINDGPVTFVLNSKEG
jgi:D-tyrosyl-tRNA(Tyr) deacylase